MGIFIKNNECFFVLFFILFLSSVKLQAQIPDTLVYASDSNYPPYEYLNRKGQPVGFTVDLIKAVAKELKKPLKIKLGNWAVIRKEFENDSSIHITDMYQVPENQVFGEFTSPFEISSVNIYIRKNREGIATLNDLTGRKVSIEGENSIHRRMKKDYPDIFFIPTASEPKALDALLHDKCDAAILSSQLFTQMQKERKLIDVVTISEPILYLSYGFVVKKGQIQLQQEVNNALLKIKASGEFDKLRYDWFIKESFWSQNAGIIISLVLILVFGVIIFNSLLRRRIKVKTIELKKTLNEQLIDRLHLRLSEEKFLQLAENIDDVFFISNPDKSVMEYISPAFEKIWGRSREEIYNNPTSLLESVLEIDRQKVLDSFAKQAKGEVIKIDYRIRNAYGEIRHILSAAYPVKNEDGEVYRITGIAKDITKLKEAEQVLHQSNLSLDQLVKERTAALEEANKELEDLNEIFIGNEIKIIELKEEIQKLKNKAKD